MKMTVKRFLPLVILVFLLALVISMLPQNGNLDSSAPIDLSDEPNQAVLVGA